MDLDDPTERQKWLARLVASAKGHARKAGRPFELTTEFIETLYAQQRGPLRRYGASTLKPLRQSVTQSCAIRLQCLKDD
jgi:hypothetical protein